MVVAETATAIDFQTLQHSRNRSIRYVHKIWRTKEFKRNEWQKTCALLLHNNWDTYAVPISLSLLAYRFSIKSTRPECLSHSLTLSHNLAGFLEARKNARTYIPVSTHLMKLICIFHLPFLYIDILMAVVETIVIGTNWNAEKPIITRKYVKCAFPCIANRTAHD